MKSPHPKPGVTETFEAFNERFYSLFDDPAVFDCQEFNILKLAQDGLKVQYSGRSRLSWPVWAIRALHFLKRLVARLRGGVNPFEAVDTRIRTQGLATRPWLVFDDGTFTLDPAGSKVPVYSQRLFEVLGRDQVTYLKEVPPRNGEDLGYDVSLPMYLPHEFWLSVTPEDAATFRALRNTVRRLRRETRFSAEACTWISISCYHMWMVYRIVRHILQTSTASACYLNCHYHKEGIILALRRKGIFVTELQHGLIAPMDIFYVYPPVITVVRDRALFADQLWVWGPYWEEVVRQGFEYPPSRLTICGYYNYENPQPTADIEALVSTRTAGGGQVILVATQTMLDAYFVDYVTWLSADLLARGNHSVILVKPHPAEGFTPYESLRACPNVILTLDPVSGLFKLADVLVTIYSTVLYEALRHHLPVYALWVESCAGYVSDILQTGAARRLELRQNPLDLHTESSPAEPEHFFSPFQPEMFLHPIAAPVS